MGIPTPPGGPAEHCVQVAWPATALWMNLARRDFGNGSPSWMGSLIRLGRDPSGQYYRRNRYFDASAGRFTQQDPIGLAGGLNLYGYANGDPVGYADPYGLCPYAGEKGKRDTATKNCPDDDIGEAVRAIDQYGGKLGRRTIKTITEQKLNPIRVDAATLATRCGDDAGGACLDRNDLVLSATAIADLAAEIVHEAGHASIPDTRPWPQQYRYEEPIVSAWHLEMWGSMPPSLRATRGGYGPHYSFYRRDVDGWRRNLEIGICRTITRRQGTC